MPDSHRNLLSRSALTLLSLPRELRDGIYTYVFTPTLPIPESSLELPDFYSEAAFPAAEEEITPPHAHLVTGEDVPSLLSTFPALSRVCRQLFYETLLIYFALPRCIVSFPTTKSILVIVEWLKGLGDEAIRGVRRIQFVEFKEEGVDEIFNIVKQFPSVEELRIAIRTIHYQPWLYKNHMTGQYTERTGHWYPKRVRRDEFPSLQLDYIVANYSLERLFDFPRLKIFTFRFPDVRGLQEKDQLAWEVGNWFEQGLRARGRDGKVRVDHGGEELWSEQEKSEEDTEDNDEGVIKEYRPCTLGASSSDEEVIEQR